jgi:prefoldin subunit 5
VDREGEVMNANLRIDPHDRSIAALEKRVANLEEAVKQMTEILKDVQKMDQLQTEILVRLSSKIADLEGD